MIGQILTGIGVVAGGAALGIRAAHRSPVPADVAAQLRAALQSTNDATLAAVVKALETGANGKWKHQGIIVQRATKVATADAKLPADVKAMYNGALSSGNTTTMRTLAKSLASKYPVLAGNLNDVARILGG